MIVSTRFRQLLLACAAVVTLASGCGDGSARPDLLVDDPVLHVPRMVYVGQSFTMDGSASSMRPGPIRAYVFSVDAERGFVTSSPALQYRYGSTGIYAVDLQLLGGRTVSSTTVEVVTCDTPTLGCGPLPQNPCPEGYACVGAECAPDHGSCAKTSDCSYPYVCTSGRCALTGECPELPPDPFGPVDPPDVVDDVPPDVTPDTLDTSPTDVPPLDVPVDTRVDIPDGCVSHEDCAMTEFCMPSGRCELADCGDDCMALIVSAHVVKGATRVTGLAAASAFIEMPDDFGLLVQDGQIYWGVRLWEPTPSPGPLPADGVIELIDELADISTVGAYRSWVGLDIAPFAGGPGDVGLYVATNVDTPSRQPPFALRGSAPHLWGAPAFAPPWPFPWPEDWEDSEFPLLANTPQGGPPVGYDVRSGELRGGDELERLLDTYRPMDGAVVCGFAMDGSKAVFLENRIGRSGAGGLAFTAARLVTLVQGAEPVFFSLPTTAACAVDTSIFGTIFVAEYLNGDPMLFELKLP